MKRMVTVIGLLTVSVLLAASGLSCSQGKIQATLGQEFTLPVGRTAEISEEGLTLEFREVESDSRCPSGAECVQAGEAKCQVRVKYQGTYSDIVMVYPGADKPIFGSLGDFEVSASLEPYPEVGKEIDASEYRLVMTVSK